MLPKFPKFKKLELSDREDIEKITLTYEPYSDFTFISLWSWDIQGQMRISELNGNLVVRFTNYIDGHPFYTFLGDKESTDTANKLINFSVSEGLIPKLDLVPEASIKNIDQNLFDVIEDRDHFDYIFSIQKLSSYDGGEYARHRRQIKKFVENKYEIVTLNLADKTNQKLLLDLVEWWFMKNKKHEESEDYLDASNFKNELAAFKRLLSSPPELFKSLICFSLFVDGVLSGFIINEKISDKYCIAHFGKADVKHEGIYQFLMHQNAKVFMDLGINYLNHEQDLGYDNLRFSKNMYRPTHFLKKYSLAFKIGSKL